MKGYSFWGLVRLARDLLLTKIVSGVHGWKLRLLRYPYYIRGIKYIKIGKGFTSGVGLRIDVLKMFDNSPLLSIGENVKINDYVHIGCTNKVLIGNNVLIASKVYISDHNHGYYDELNFSKHESPKIAPDKRRITSDGEVIIEDNVWIGEFVSILPGVKIGEGSIIGTMSVVTKNIPPYSVVVGTPAKVIKKYCFETNVWKRV